MSNHAVKKTSWAEPSLFGDDQKDLFGSANPAPKIYQPKPRHVRNSLIKLVGEMEAASVEWPWPSYKVKRYRDGWLEHLCTLLPDQTEADEWRARIKIQIARLEAADEGVA